MVCEVRPFRCGAGEKDPMFGGVSQWCEVVVKAIFVGANLKVVVHVRCGVALWLRDECVRQNPFAYLCFGHMVYIFCVLWVNVHDLISEWVSELV
jgi:hypothetical protein